MTNNNGSKTDFFNNSTDITGNNLNGKLYHNLATELEKLPKHWRYTPVKGKAAYLRNWQSTPNSSTKLLPHLKTTGVTGYGLLTGENSGGLLAIDIDGESASKLFDILLKHWGLEFPNTVAWTSGKSGRQQLLFQMPTEYGEKFKDFNKRDIKEFSGFKCGIGDDGKQEKIEFRYNAMQSVLPPSVHPETGSYQWLNHPSDTPVMVLPTKIADFILNPEPIAMPTTLSSSWDLFNANFTLPCNEVQIDIVELIPPSFLDGRGEGERDNGGIALARELKAVRGFLQTIGQSYQDCDDLSVLRGYASRCTPSLTDRDVDRWYRSRDKYSDNPTLDVDRIKSKIASKARKANKATAIRTGAGNTTNGNGKINGNGKGNNIPLLTNSQVMTEIKKIANTNSNDSEKLVALKDLEDKSGFKHSELASILKKILDEESEKVDHDTVKKELDERIAVVNGQIDIAQIVPESIANPLKRKAEYFNVKPELLLLCLFAGISSVDHQNTRIYPHRLDNWKEVPSIYAAIIAVVAQLKTPVLNEMVGNGHNAIREILAQDYKERYDQYLDDLAEYEALSKDERKEKYPNGEPTKPYKWESLVHDVTQEGLDYRISRQPELGICQFRDELKGLFLDFNRSYGNSGDGKRFLERHTGAGYTTERKTEGLSVSYPYQLFSCVGGVQPKVLEDMLKQDDTDGKWARFDFVHQPLTKFDYNPDKIIDIQPMLEWLYVQAYNNLKERKVYFSDDANKVLRDVLNKYEERKITHPNENIQGILGKVRGKIVRYAYLIKKISLLMNNQSLDGMTIDADDVYRADKWVGYLTQQIAMMFDTTSSLSPVLQKILSLTDITCRNVQRRCHLKAPEARQHLQLLESMGYITPLPDGKEYVLSQVSQLVTNVVTPSTPSKNREFNPGVTNVTNNNNFSTPSSSAPGDSKETGVNFEEKNLSQIYSDTRDIVTNPPDPLPRAQSDCHKVCDTPVTTVTTEVTASDKPVTTPVRSASTEAPITPVVGGEYWHDDNGTVVVVSVDGSQCEIKRQITGQIFQCSADELKPLP